MLRILFTVLFAALITESSESDITWVVTRLGRQVSSLLRNDATQNQTIQTQIKQHTSFKDLHSKQKLAMDILTDKIDTQKQDIDRQNQQINELEIDNTKKQHQIDILIDNMEHQNETIHELMGLLQPLIKKHGCPDGWTFYTGDETCIKFFGIYIPKEKLSWSKARESCQTFGGDLVIIRDQDKNNFVFEMVAGSDVFPWIGVKNQASRGYNFTYVDESALGSHHPWMKGQPQGDQDDDRKCVGMYTLKSYPGEWFDFSCSHARPYACSTY